jgi:hypothetical protein
MTLLDHDTFLIGKESVKNKIINTQKKLYIKSLSSNTWSQKQHQHNVTIKKNKSKLNPLTYNMTISKQYYQHTNKKY